MNKILIVHENKNYRDDLKKILHKEDNILFEAMNGKRMVQILQEHPIDVVILGLLLVDGHACDFIKEIRKKQTTPIIIMGSDQQKKEEIQCLYSGADDFFHYPCQKDEIIARITVHLRRFKELSISEVNETTLQNNHEKIKFGNWVLDRSNFQITDKNQQRVPLTYKEFLVMEVLATHSGKTLRREDLFSALTKKGYKIQGRALDVKISRLRKKLHDHDKQKPLIQTIHGVGYMLNA